MTTDEPILLPKTTILKLLDLKATQFDSMKSKGHLPKSLGSNKHAKYDLKAVIQAWVAYQVAQIERGNPADDEDVQTQLTRAKLEGQQIKNAKDRKDLITQDAALALLNHYVTTLRNALITLEFSWAPEVIGLKTEVESMKKLAELRDRLLLTLNDPEDFSIDGFLDDLDSTAEEESVDDSE